jgi:hypothetical protein
MRLPGLISIFAEVDGRDHATIAHAARVIREAGFIPTAKRGVGAAEMTVKEAVNLFLALNGGDLPKDGPRAIKLFRSLRKTYALSSPKKIAEVPVLKAITNESAFGDALEAAITRMNEVRDLVELFIDENFTTEEAKSFKKTLENTSWSSNPVAFEVQLSRYSAQILLSITDGHGGRTIVFEANYTVDLKLFFQGFYKPLVLDRSVTIKVSGFTLLKLWKGLKVEPDKAFSGKSS